MQCGEQELECGPKTVDLAVMATHVPRRSEGLQRRMDVAPVRGGGLDDVAAELPQDVVANQAGHAHHRPTHLAEVLVVCGHRAPSRTRSAPWVIASHTANASRSAVRPRSVSR